jgi:hypothetical protein
MGAKAREALDCSIRMVEINRPVIEQILREAGADVSPEMVFTAAKYYDTLNKLARE